MVKSKKLVKKLFKKIEKTKDKSKVIKDSFSSVLQKQYKEAQQNLISIFSKLKEEINKRSKESIIAEKIREAKKSGQDRPLTSKEQKIRSNFVLILERELIIIKVVQQLEERKINFNKICPNFGKYVLCNFYRTLCEISLRLFTDILLLIIEWEVEDTNNQKVLSSLEKQRNKILNNALGLDDLKVILGRFDKKLDSKLNLAKIIDEYFLYKEGEGFSLRNNIAHEKVLLSEIDSKFVIDQIKRVNMFNFSFIQVFFLDIINFSEKDMKLAKKLLG